MAWYMRGWGTVCSLVGLQPVRKDGCWQTESTASFSGQWPGCGVFLFKPLGHAWNGYNILEYFPDSISLFMPLEQMEQMRLAINEASLPKCVVQPCLWQVRRKGAAAQHKCQGSLEYHPHQGTEVQYKWPEMQAKSSLSPPKISWRLTWWKSGTECGMVLNGRPSIHGLGGSWSWRLGWTKDAFPHRIYI